MRVYLALYLLTCGYIVYGAHVATTVVPILAELVLNQVKYGLSDFQRNCMLVLYVPFFLVPVLAVIDSSIRVTKMIKQNDPTVVKIKETTKTD
jgi:multisubunit Na+/H+ antiporter MnhE subunit